MCRDHNPLLCVSSPVYPPMSPVSTTPIPTTPIPTSAPGNDYPISSNSYVLTVYGTDQTFTLSGGENIVLATYSKTNQNQIFRCDSVPSTNRLGFVNIPSNRRILRNQFEDVRARPQGNPSVWESFAFEPLQRWWVSDDLYDWGCVVCTSSRRGNW